jgi:hypothetical protein
LGAGASCPGVPPAGQVESEILKLLKADKVGEADKKTIQFLKQFKQPMSELLGEDRSDDVGKNLTHYVDFIQTIDALLSERKTNLLPLQASIFATNYDLFIECASEQCPSILLTRSKTVAAPITLKALLRDLSLALERTVYRVKVGVRLVGVSISKLQTADEALPQLELGFVE